MTPTPQPPRTYVLSGDVQLTPDDLIAGCPVPDGYELRASQRRQFKYRALWDVTLNFEGDRVAGVRVYNLAAGLRMIQKVAWQMAGSEE